MVTEKTVPITGEDGVMAVMTNLMAGAGIMNAGLEVMVPVPVDGVKVIVALLNAIVLLPLVAVKLLNVAMLLEFVVAVVVPESVQLEDCPVLTAALTVIPAPIKLPY